MKQVYNSVDELPAVFSVDVLCAFLSISRAGAYTLSHSEGFPVITVGKRRLIPKDRFLEWLNNSCDYMK